MVYQRKSYSDYKKYWLGPDYRFEFSYYYKPISTSLYHYDEYWPYDWQSWRYWPTWRSYYKYYMDDYIPSYKTKAKISAILKSIKQVTVSIQVCKMSLYRRSSRYNSIYDSTWRDPTWDPDFQVRHSYARPLRNFTPLYVGEENEKKESYTRGKYSSLWPLWERTGRDWGSWKYFVDYLSSYTSVRDLGYQYLKYAPIWESGHSWKSWKYFNDYLKSYTTLKDLKVINMGYRYPFYVGGGADLDRPVRYNRDHWPYDYYTEKSWPSFREARECYVPQSYSNYFSGKWPREYYMDSGSLYSYLRHLRVRMMII
ncbi:unnamed protein product [Brassicogethes aeneus]|uniref:Uncharacterized protein n=1 Tax=Brassicogethes aeneus TaxID=1431903 RepID=A0A9P0AY23_BRAAE|nr:unnamed protein product [Brassicogethes aeneus]